MKTLKLSSRQLELLRFVVGDFIDYEQIDGFGEEESCKVAESVQKKIIGLIEGGD